MLRRQPPRNLLSGNAYLIVTEGQKTEPDYFVGLRDQLKLSSIDVEITPADGTDPVSIVNYAVSLRDQRKQSAKRDIATPNYDAVWAVFDTERADTNQKLNDALQRAAARQISVALSNPAFEYWILLHYEFTTASFLDCWAVIKRIKEQGHIPDYAKGSTPVEEMIKRIADAVKHAGQCRQSHVGCQTDAEHFWNPYTQVDRLVTELNEATRPHLQLQLD
ncbi:RloB family protein [Verrucomicrobiota bacterium]